MDKNLVVIGSDETGVGDYFTPLVVTAAFVPIQNINYFKSNIGVRDSKKLNDKQIEIIYEKIKMHIKSRTKIMFQSEYNFLNKQFNSHELKTLLHFQAISSLEKDIKPDLVIIDKFASKENITKYFNHLKATIQLDNIKTKYECIEKAESFHVSVAVASIVARKKLLDLMKSQNEKWEIIFPLGANQNVKTVAKSFIGKHGIDNLKKVAKIHFKTTKEIIN